MIPDQEMYPVSCQASKVVVLSICFYSASKLGISLSPNLQCITNKHLFKMNVKTFMGETSSC